MVNYHKHIIEIAFNVKMQSIHQITLGKSSILVV